MADDFRPNAITTVPSAPGACRAGSPNTCDQFAVLSDDTMRTRLELWHPDRVAPITRDFAESKALAVHGFHYDLGRDARIPSRPASSSRTTA